METKTHFDDTGFLQDSSMTELKELELEQAMVKAVRASAPEAQQQFAIWHRVRQLRHPHLLASRAAADDRGARDRARSAQPLDAGRNCNRDASRSGNCAGAGSFYHTCYRARAAAAAAAGATPSSSARDGRARITARFPQMDLRRA